MFCRKITIDLVKGNGVKVTLSAFLANFCLYTFNDVKTTSQPMLFLDLLFPGFTTAKLTNHFCRIL